MEVEGIITAPARWVRTSVNNNPTYAVSVDGVVRHTVTDGQVGYAATNFHYGDRVRVTLDAKGLVTHMKKVEE